MIRNLKALGLAMMAAFAFSAVAASGAPAQVGQLTADGPVTLIGTEREGLNRFTAFGSNVDCTSVYTGHKYDVTPHEPVQPGATTVTITPHYSDCEDPESGEARTVNMNGCEYVFHTGATTGGEHTYGVRATVNCPSGKAIQITGGPCTVTVGGGSNNQDLTGAHLRHLTSGEGDDIVLEGAFTNVHAVACGFLTTNSAVLHVDVTIEGKDEEGKDVPVTITH